MAEQKYYSVKDVADMLHCGTWTVLHWIKCGQLKAFRAVRGGKYSIPCTEIDNMQNK
jgi:excisionase family DNA binding protein